MTTIQDQTLALVGRSPARLILRIVIGMAAVSATVASAIATKEMSGRVVPMAAVDTVAMTDEGETRVAGPVIPRILGAPESAPDAGEEFEAARADLAAGLDQNTLKYAEDPQVRWFNGRPARPARKLWMTVTAYSPDARSCGESADGHTATMHSVQTNGMKLVAADTSILPYGSMVSVPGYATEEIVPVLDCGGAIKGRRLDVLYPTDKQARQWGRQRVLITVWEYADGKPAENPRKVR